MNRHSSTAFVQVGCDLWSLNPELANETEKDIYERCLEKEKSRKRKRRHHRIIHYIISILEITEPLPLFCSPDQVEMCLDRVLQEIRQQQQQQQQTLHKTNPSNPSNASSFSSDIPLPFLNDPTNETEEREMIEDPFHFLQQDPFEDISLSDCTRKIKQKYGDEGFCFIMQVFFHSFILLFF